MQPQQSTQALQLAQRYSAGLPRSDDVILLHLWGAGGVLAVAQARTQVVQTLLQREWASRVLLEILRQDALESPSMCLCAESRAVVAIKLLT